MTTSNKLRVGNRVTILETPLKRYVNKQGIVTARKKDDFFPDTDIFLITVPGKLNSIWVYGSQLEKIAK